MTDLKLPELSVAALVRDNTREMKLRVLSTRHELNRPIKQRDLHRPGLALTGFIKKFPHECIQLLGQAELRYLHNLSETEARTSLENLFNFNVPCVVISSRTNRMKLITDIGEKRGIPVIRTGLKTADISYLLTIYLAEKFAPTCSEHATLVDVYGTGLLFIGRAGIGKSEIALDLVERGHRLVADDKVILMRKPPGLLIGTGTELLKHLIEIRGVGVLNIRQMLGVRAIRLQKRVETVVELQDWDSELDYERLGLEERYHEYLGIKIPLVQLPIYPGKNVTVIAESIALNLQLKVYGDNAAKQLSKRLYASLRDKKRIKDYLRGDRE